MSQFVVLTHVRVKDCDKNSWIVSQSVVLTNVMVYVHTILSVKMVNIVRNIKLKYTSKIFQLYD